MVATRGGARTGADDNLETTVRKKPVRKTVSKAAKAAITTNVKTKRTRNAELEPEQADDVDDLQRDPGESVLQPPLPGQRAKTSVTEDLPKPTRQASARGKKDEKPKATASGTLSKPVKAASTRTAKTKPTEQAHPELPPPAQSRATRATRATAAKEKVSPLSPKKITQVSKPPARSTRATGAKAATIKPTQSKSAAKGKTAPRRRNLSDENAQISERNPTEDSSDEIEVQSRALEPLRELPASASQCAGKETAVSTPPKALAEEGHESHKELQDDTAQRWQETESDDEFEHDSEQLSADELCGPKTPMKRCSPRERLRHASVKKSAPALDIPMKTPVRRFAVLGTRQGTPQTQKPYCKPAVTLSGMKSMTVARAQSRALVFPSLQPLPDMRLEESNVDDADKTVRHEDEHGILAATENISHDPENRLEPEMSVYSPIINTLQSGTGFEDTVMFDASHDHASNIEIKMADGPENKGSTSDLSSAEPSDQLEDTETTIVVTQDASEEYDNGTDPFMAPEDSDFITQDSRAINNHEDFCHPMKDAQMASVPPKTQTLVWENVQEHVAIPFSFEPDLGGLRSAFHIDFESAWAKDTELVAAQSHEDRMSCDLQQGSEARSSRESIGSTRASLDATVNISDFIDINTLSESRPVDSDDVEHHDTVVSVQKSLNSTEKAPNPEEWHINRGQSAGEATRIVDIETAEVPLDKEEPAVLRFPEPTTPTCNALERDFAIDNLQQDFEIPHATPRYAMPTIASWCKKRRQSLPAIHPRTPLVDNTRPQTSDGASMPRIANPRAAEWLANARIASRATPTSMRPNTAHGIASLARISATTPTMKTKAAKTPATSVPMSAKVRSPNKTPIARTLFARTPGTSVPECANSTPWVLPERYPGLQTRDTYEELAATATPSSMLNALSSGERSSGEDANLVVSTSAKSTPAQPERLPREPYNLNNTTRAQINDEGTPKTPQPAAEERLPRLPCRRTYEEHAQTAMPESRFRTPARVPTKRPATAQKATSLRRTALVGSMTPVKTPLKDLAATPGQELMTPHPAAPLHGVVALVEVYTSDGGCATPAFLSLLQRLGAKTTKTFSDRITHLVFKEGPPNTLQRLRIHNKQVAEMGIGHEILCVNSRWVTDCDTMGRRVDEHDEAYAVDVEDVPRSAKRRRKTMEPTSLINLGGNVIRERKSSLGRMSLGRSPAETLPSTPKIDSDEKENSGEDTSPVTPAYLAAPSTLLQHTAPINRVMKLASNAKYQTENRRLTSWNGRA